MLGGEAQRGSRYRSSGYAKAHCIGRPSYLEPNRNSLQEPIGGRSENDGGGVTIGVFRRQYMLKTGCFK
jgi:hypothetical protein